MLSRDGIEVHFDAKQGRLELACEPDAFSPYRELARSQLVGLPDISFDKVIEIEIIDTATLVARRNTPRRRLVDWAIVAVLVLVLSFAVIGVVAVFRLLATGR